MNNRFINIIALIASSAVFISGCSGSGFDGSNTDTNNTTVKTDIADQNSLTITAEKIAVEALAFDGETMEVTAYVADRNNNPVPDNTSIRFLTNGGKIEPECFTIDGFCTVIWTDQNPEPATKVAIVIGYTRGEESWFDSLNDNDKYDFGEAFGDIPEPFFDVDDNGARDNSVGSLETFVDGNGNDAYDVADGVYTGTSCVGDVTVCSQEKLLIWMQRDIILSSSSASITQTGGAFPGNIDTPATFTFDIFDTSGLGHPMPDGTTVEISTTGGSVANSSIDLAANQTSITVRYTSGDPVSGSDSITIDVKSPAGLVTTKTF